MVLKIILYSYINRINLSRQIAKKGFIRDREKNALGTLDKKDGHTKRYFGK
jgi:hypothetical protein